MSIFVAAANSSRLLYELVDELISFLVTGPPRTSQDYL